ncbi:MAG TPA: histidinol-phosphate transaminase [Candidatus Limnocylindrales bacterium]|nr:histidinol-phosphate transaminase [Candidatus Limnocylindrales bacterium]
MSPTPVTFASPIAAAGYSWEATSAEIGRRYGIDPAAVVRFDLNTAPAPPAVAVRTIAAGRFAAPLSEYPPSDYSLLVDAATAAYGVEREELLVGAGADEVLDLCAKAFLPPAGVAVAAVPTYAMHRVLTEQRPARFVGVPRRGPEDGWRLDAERLRVAARDEAADLVWLCNPNNPTGLAEPHGVIAGLLDDLRADAEAADRAAPIVVLDEAYAEFAGVTLLPLRRDHSNLVVVRTASKAYALAGLRVGFAVARPETIARLAPYRPPGSVSVVSVAAVAATMVDLDAMRQRVASVSLERERWRTALAAIGWPAGPSATNFLLVDLGSPERAAAAAEHLLRHGLVPRTFPAGHLLAAYLRLTVRTPADDDRLVDVAAAM